MGGRILGRFLAQLQGKTLNPGFGSHICAGKVVVSGALPPPKFHLRDDHLLGHGTRRASAFPTQQGCSRPQPLLPEERPLACCWMAVGVGRLHGLRDGADGNLASCLRPATELGSNLDGVVPSLPTPFLHPLPLAGLLVRRN